MLSHRLTLSVFAIYLVAVLLSSACNGDDGRRSAYIAANLQLFEELQVLPMATEVSREHLPYSFHELLFERPDGWSTVITLKLDAEEGSEDEIRSQLRAALLDWRASSDELGLDFCKAGALIGFDFTRFRQEGTIRVYIDHESARSGVRLTAC